MSKNSKNSFTYVLSKINDDRLRIPNINYYIENPKNISNENDSNLLISRHPMSSMLRDFDFTHCFEMDEGMLCAKHNALEGLRKSPSPIFASQGNAMAQAGIKIIII